MTPAHSANAHCRKTIDENGSLSTRTDAHEIHLHVPKTVFYRSAYQLRSRAYGLLRYLSTGKCLLGLLSALPIVKNMER